MKLKCISLLAAIVAGSAAVAITPASARAAPGDDHDHDHPPATSVASSPAASMEHDHDHDHTDEVILTPDAIKRYGVVIGKAEPQSLTSSFVAPARVVFNSDAMAHVGSSVTGRVSDLKIKLGDVVKKGDVLAVIDSPDLGEAQSDFLLKHTAIDTARPAVQLAKDAYDRARQLLDQTQGIAVSEVQKRESELRTAEGTLRAAQAAATAAENKLHLYGMSQEDVATLLKTSEIAPRYRVLAPIDGQVIEREVTLGELVSPDRDALLVIADLSSVWVIADVPEARIAEVGKGSVARVRLAALRGSSLEGTVTYIAPALDPQTRSAKVRIEVSNTTATLRPGMFAQATISPPANNAGAALAIPEAAIQTVEGAPVVFVPVEGEPNTFAVRDVTVGPAVAGPNGLAMVEVFAGLEPGESLVISGSFILKAELGKAGAAHEH